MATFASHNLRNVNNCTFNNLGNVNFWKINNLRNVNWVESCQE